MAKLNFLLLIAAMYSAIYIVNHRANIQKQTAQLGKAQEQSIRLKQDHEDLLFEYSQAIDLGKIKPAAERMKMQQPVHTETITSQPISK